MPLTENVKIWDENKFQLKREIHISLQNSLSKSIIYDSLLLLNQSGMTLKTVQSITSER